MCRCAKVWIHFVMSLWLKSLFIFFLIQHNKFLSCFFNFPVSFSFIIIIRENILMSKLVCLLLLACSAKALNAQIDLFDFDYETVDHKMITHPPDTSQSADQLITYINEQFLTEHEKFRAIFVWTSYFYSDTNAIRIKTNIFKNSKETLFPLPTFIETLCAKCNLTCRSVMGKTKTCAYSAMSNYFYYNSWNIIKLNGREYLSDIRASVYENLPNYPNNLNDFDDHYFLMNPATFIFNNFPNDSTDQLLSPTISLETFQNTACIFPKAINYEITSISPSSLLLEVKRDETIFFYYEMTYPPVHMSIEILKNLDDERPTQEDIEFEETVSGIKFEYQIKQTKNCYLCVRFDEQDAVYYKLTVTR